MRGTHLDGRAVGLLDDIEHAALAGLNAVDDTGAGAAGVQLEVDLLLDGEGGHCGSCKVDVMTKNLTIVIFRLLSWLFFTRLAAAGTLAGESLGPRLDLVRSSSQQPGDEVGRWRVLGAVVSVQ